MFVHGCGNGSPLTNGFGELQDHVPQRKVFFLFTETFKGLRDRNTRSEQGCHLTGKSSDLLSLDAGADSQFDSPLFGQGSRWRERSVPVGRGGAKLEVR